MTSAVTTLSDGLWRGLPGRLRRVSALLWLTFSDGDYLRAWPPVALAAPAAAAVAGVLLGAFHSGPVYTYSFAVMAVLAAIGGLGAVLGVWAWIGFVVADALLADRSVVIGWVFTSTAWYRFQTSVALVLSYVLLAGLMVLFPAAATGFRLRTTAALVRLGAAAARPLAPAAGLAVQVLVQSVLTYFWAHSTAFLIRPLWSYSGRVPDIAAIQPLQAHALALAVTVAVVVLGRAGLMLWAATLPRPAQPAAAPVRPLPIPRWVFVPPQALFLTVLMSGLLDSLGQAAIVALLIGGILFARVALIPRIPVVPDVLRRIPLLVRMVVAALISYVLSTVLVVPAALAGDQSFSAMVWAVLLSMVVAALLIPAAPPAHAAERAQPSSGGQP